MFAAKAMFQWFREQLRKAEASECKAFCREHWQNTATRMYYIGLCEEEGTYEEALPALDESIAKDRSLSKLQIRDYEKQKKDIYRVIKDEEHYREQLWKLVEDYSPVDIMMRKAGRSCGNESFRLFVIFRAETSCWKRKSCMIVSWILFC